MTLVLVCALGLGSAFAAEKPESGARAISVSVVSLEGLVEVQRAGTEIWVALRTNTVLTACDRLRTGANGRALVRASEGSLARLRAGSVLEVKPPVQPSGPLINLIRGFFNFFDRDRSAEVEIRNGLASAASLGTDFALAIAEDGQVDLAVFDGAVALRNAAGSLEVPAGTGARARPQVAPEKSPGLALASLVQWTWYYPQVIAPEDLPFTSGEQEALAASLAAYRRGAVVQALESWPATVNPSSSAAARVFHAALLLAVGETAEAESLDGDIANLPAARALRRVVSAARGEVAASTVSESAAHTASEALAESYVRQARGDLPAARAAARSAREQAPQFGPAWAREAELEFSFGDLTRANAALPQALALAPEHPSALVLRGFVASGRNRLHEAAEAFAAATESGRGLADAWLGRGLVRIRRGDLRGGQDDLLVAAALEPRRALLRSYLGKAYAESRDATAARRELRLAREMDPQDPTAWLYSALDAQSGNRVNEAAEQLEQAQNLGANRGLFRSQLLLDQDRAVRGANLARIYDDAGLADFGRFEALRAVEADYGNYSAHLFLANSYFQARDPNLFGLRYDTPAFSEFLLANLLSPVGAGTLSPTISQSEYGKLFERDRGGVIANAEYLSRGAWTVSGSQFAQWNNSAYAFEGAYRNDPGEWRNGDIEQRELAFQWKQQLGPSDSLWLRVAEFEGDSGDLFARYDPGTANDRARVERLQRPVITAGLVHTWQPGLQTLLLASRLLDEVRLTDPFSSALVVARQEGVPIQARELGFQQSFENRLEQYSLELQQLWETDFGLRTVAGVAGRWGDLTSHSRLVDPVELAGLFTDPATDARVRDDVSRVSAYAYETWTPWDPLSVTAGVTYERQEFPLNHRATPIQSGTDTAEFLLPKLGVMWRPWTGGTLRAAYAQTTSAGGFDPVLQLEPTHVAGVVQSYRSVIPETLGDTPAGSRFEVFGAAFEQRFPTRTYVTVAAEWIENRAPRAVGTFVLDFDEFGDLRDLAHAEALEQRQDFRERSLSLTVDQLLGEWFTVGVAYRLQVAELETEIESVRGVAEFPARTDSLAVLHQVVPHVYFNHRSGVFASASARWLSQDNQRDDAGLGDAAHWQLDVWAGYRFRSRQAEVAVGLLNLLDEDYRLSPLNTYALPPRERTLAVRFGLRF